MSNLYIKLIIEAFLQNFLVPLSDSNLYETALRFPSIKFTIFTICMLVGFVGIQCINYSLGYVLRFFAYDRQQQNSFVEKLEKYVIPIIFVASPIQYVGAVTMLFYGFIRFRVTRIIFYSCIGKLIFSLGKMVWLSL
jgi:membrane protein YqaA with SNARE-associated domain